MEFVEFGNLLGLVLADRTIEIVIFESFLTESYDKKFMTYPRNYIVIKFEIVVRRIFYLQMFNRWLVVGSNN
jgi:hypothetical protein